jgi:hypothetical protein
MSSAMFVRLLSSKQLASLRVVACELTQEADDRIRDSSGICGAFDVHLILAALVLVVHPRSIKT